MLALHSDMRRSEEAKSGSPRIDSRRSPLETCSESQVAIDCQRTEAPRAELTSSERRLAGISVTLCALPEHAALFGN